MRDTSRITIEEAVHALTGRVAEFFGMRDRGTIEVGKAGDLCVFALDELELGEEERVWDVPYGTWRFRRKSCHQHITPNTIGIVGPLVEAGAIVRMAPCNPDSHAGLSTVELADALAWPVSESADALCDMGGELIVATAAARYPPAGALEATTTGLHRLAGVDIPFPVLDWNGIALKDLVHNRHHVGAETWPAFTAITNLSPYGREIVVVGFGPVGQGVAQRARDLGANVTVVEDPQFLDAIDESVPAELAVHAVLDNSSTHKTPAIRDWLLKHPRFTFHFTPTSSSWMNLVERWFAELTNKMLKRSARTSIAVLAADLNAWIAAWNNNPKPFVWHKTAEHILDNLKKYLTNL